MQIEEQGMPKNITVHQQTFSGDPGLPMIDKINAVLTGLNELNKDGSSKIQFFKAKKDAKLIDGCLTTFSLSSDGRLLAWFKKGQFKYEKDKYKAMYEWYIKNAEFNTKKPRKRDLN